MKKTAGLSAFVKEWIKKIPGLPSKEEALETVGSYIKTNKTKLPSVIDEIMSILGTIPPSRTAFDIKNLFKGLNSLKNMKVILAILSLMVAYNTADSKELIERTQGIVETNEPEVKKEKFVLHEVKISFDALPLKALKTESLTLKKDKVFEANFQWIKYGILFSDKKDNWYSYVTDLYPWGIKKEGGEELFASDSLGAVKKGKDVDIDITDVRKAFSKYLGVSKTELNPANQQVSYINSNKSDTGGNNGTKYSSEKFKVDFINSGKYVLLTKDQEYTDPFGSSMGKKGESGSKTALYSRAIKLAKEKEYFSGGFDIMKKFVHKQQEDQKKNQKEQK